MKSIARAVAIVLALASPAWAGLDAGVKAFTAGDYEAAMREWLPLAEQGHAAAQHNVGILFNYGHGVAADLTQAAAWYRRAAEQGHASAQVKLGYFLATGRGLGRDDGQAVAWFREAAETGLAEAQYNLAIMYQTGTGIETDKVQALIWLTLAAKGGVGAARERRDRLAAQMTPAEVAEAEVLAEALFPLAKAPPAPETPAPKPPSEPSAGDVEVHLASYRSREAAARGWAILRQAHADALGALGHTIARVDLGSQGVFFRLTAGPVGGTGAAEALCALLKSRDIFCAPAL